MYQRTVDLTLHQRYWTESADRAADPDGVVALAPLALACFAQDAGLKIRVRSDYLPGTLLGGGRVGEVTT
ncbi:Imm49 family immunity protein [Lentzea guizhouensis]|nr:Imm49 family immunity protein [Lentzea guizhouensis]